MEPPLSVLGLCYPRASLSKVCVMRPFSISAHTPLSQVLSYLTQGTVSFSLCTFSNPLP